MNERRPPPDFDSAIRTLKKLEGAAIPTSPTLRGAPSPMAHPPESNVAPLVENLRQVRDQVTDRSKEVAQTLDTEIRKNPWIYIGFAALLSAFVGFLIGRGSRR